MGRHLQKIIDFQLVLDDCFQGIAATQAITAIDLKNAYHKHLSGFLAIIVSMAHPANPQQPGNAVTLLNTVGLEISAVDFTALTAQLQIDALTPGFLEVPAYFKHLTRYDAEAEHRIISSRLAVAILLLAGQEVTGFDSQTMLHSLDQNIKNMYKIISEHICLLNDYLDHQGIVSYIFRIQTTPPSIPKSELESRLAATSPQALPTIQPQSAVTSQPAEQVIAVLAELNELVGIAAVKEEVRSLINLVQVRQLRVNVGLPTPPLSLHLVFTGNPGTGKTTVARLIARVFKALGLLEKGHLVEVDRAGLVAGYVGQTALKVQEVLDKAIGGVLFIDEAYALVTGRGETDFGSEAVDILLKGIEDHRDNLIVIVAGYQEPMEEFLASNPGIRSRFNRYIHFDDYTAAELLEIFKRMCRQNGYCPTEAATQQTLVVFEHLCQTKKEHFANARTVRNFLEKTIANQANRLVTQTNPDKEALAAIQVTDLPSVEEI